MVAKLFAKHIKLRGRTSPVHIFFVQADREHRDIVSVLPCSPEKNNADLEEYNRGNRLCQEDKVFYSDLPLYTPKFSADPSRMGIGVGTPSRIIDLFDSGKLHVISSHVIHQLSVRYAADLGRCTIIIQSGTGSS